MSRKLKSYGRKRLTSSVKEKDLNADSIRKVLLDVLPTHINNTKDSEYLFGVYKGEQEIYSKIKDFRSDINNKFVENHLLHAVKFKVGYTFDNVQYVQVANDEDNETLNKEMDVFNEQLNNAQKSAVTNELAKRCYISGVAPLLTYYKKEEEVPIELVPLDPGQGAVVYSSDFRGQPLFSIEIHVVKQYNEDGKNEDKVVIHATSVKNRFRYEISKNDYYSLGVSDLDTGSLKYIKTKEDKYEVNIRGDIPIHEYTLNDERMGIVEIGLDAQNALNKLTSSSIDELEQWVQSLLVGIDVDIPEEVFEQAKAQGVLLLHSGEEKQGKLDLLSQELDYQAIQSVYDGIQNRLYTVLGVPLLNIGGGGGDTGEARITDNGWMMADTKSREDENGYKKSDKSHIEFFLTLLKKEGLIKELKASDIEIKFNRNKTDNIQSKVQALMMLVKAGVAPRVAMEIVDLFGDVDAVYRESVKFFGEDYYLGTSQDTKNNFGVEENDKDIETVEPTQ